MAGTAGGAGGAGGNGTQFGEGGGGGGGGGGAIGSTIAGPATILAPVSAGSGGAGGAGGVSAMPGSAQTTGGGGGGGAGGIGLLVTGAASISNLSTITGGAGGAGGAPGAATGGETSGNGGQGGDGGAGLKFAASGSTLTNSGTITGGAGGPNGANSFAGVPFGGAGVTGANLTIVNSGTIAGGVNQLGNTSSAIEFTGGANTLTLQPGWVLTGAISVSGSVTFNQSFNTNVASKITGDGAVIQNGTGTLTLSGINNYSGGTTISGGTLAITNVLSVSSELITLDGGTFQAAAAGLYMTNAVAINTTNGTVDTQANTLTLARIIADGNGSGALSKSGSGRLVLGGVNTYSGLTSINEGTLALGVVGACNGFFCFPDAFGSVAASSGVVIAAGAVFDLSNAHELSEALGTTIKSLAGTGTVVLGSGTLALSNAAGTFGGAINGAGGLTLTAGTQTLTGSNGYTGATTLNGGTLALSGAGSIAASSGVITAAGAVLDISAATGGGATIQSLGGTGGTVTLGTKTLTLSNATAGFFDPSGTFAGAINGTGGLTLTAGSEALFGTNGYTGATTINGGVLAIAGNGSIAASSGVNLAANAGLDFTWTNSGVTLQALAGAGGTVTLGSHTLTLSNASGTFGGAIMDTGGVTLAAGTQILSGTNTYTGATTIDGGTLALSGAGSIAASSGVSMAAGAVLDISASTGGGATIKSLAGTGGSVTLGTKTLTLSNASGTFAGAIAGGGGLTLTAGTETLTGSQGYSGATTINGGTLALSGAGSIAASSGVSTAAGTVLDLSASTGGGATIRSLAGTGGTVALGTRTLTLSSASGTFGGAINGSGGLALAAGTETLTGSNGYSGATTINGGTLALSGAGSIATSSGVSTAAGAVLDIAASAGGGAAIKSLAGTGGTVALGTRTLTLSNASGTFGGALNGSGGLTLTAGTETLTGSQGYSGATTINGGTLALSGAGSIAASSGVSTAAGAVLDISASTGGGAAIKSLAGTGGTVTLGTRTLTLSNASGTFGGAINGSGGLALTAGTQTLTGNSSAFTGTVTINSGRLLMGAGGTLGNGAAVVNVNNGGTLGGSGTVGGNVAVNAGGILSAGFSPGTLTISGDLVQNSGAISTFELGQPGIVGGASNDFVKVGGNLTMGGTLNLVTATAGWYRLYDVAGTISGSYGTVNSGALTNTIYATIPNQLNVLLAGAGQIVQFWDGTDATGNGAVNGGTGSWSAANTNMTSQPGAQINDQWRGGVGVFAGVAGTVTVAGTQSIQGLQFTVDGYSLVGGTLNLTGDPFSDPTKSFITTDAAVTATIGSTIAGAGIGLTKQGAGTLILTGANSYDGGTTINAGTLQIGDGGTTGSIIGDITDNAILAINRSDIVTFAKVVSGTGALHQNGTGTLILTGTNLYTGGTTINAGTLQIGDGGTIGSIVGDVTNNAILAVNRSGALTLSGDISGTGVLQQNGTGTLILTGTNSYTGSTTISAGTLQIGNGGTTGSIAGDITNDSVLAINRTDALTLSGDISGTGMLQQNGTGVTTLAGAASYLGATMVNAGTLRANAANRFSTASAVTIAAGAALDANGFDQAIASLTGAGNVALGAGRLTLANAVSTLFSGTIAGSGGLTLAAGTQTLSGVSSYTGATAINGGTLIVNGSILASSGVTVAAGASIGGSGQLPSLTVNGTVSPGNSPGTLTVNGNLVLGAGSTYVAEIQGAVSDRINVTGTASLAGTLRLAPLGGAYLFSAPYTLLAAAGGRTGSFSPVDTTGSFGDGVTTSVAYTATEVQLTLSPKPLAPIIVDPTPTPPSRPGSDLPASDKPGPGRSTNAFAVARGIDAAVANGADPSLLFAIYNLPAAAIPAAVNQLSGEIHTAAPAMANSAAGQFLRTMLDGSATGRLANGPGGAAGFTADLPSRQDGVVRASLDPARFSLWGASFGSTGRSDGDRAVGSANRNLSDGHLAFGADIRLGNTTVVGAAVAGGQSHASLSGGLGKAKADVFQAGLYGRTVLGPVNLAAALGYARLDTDTNRAIPALARSGVAASYVTQAWSGRVEASMPVANWGGFTLSPLAAFQAVQARSPAAVERDRAGATAGMLTLARRSDITSRSELGLQLDATLMLGATPVTGFVRAAWARYYQRDADLTASINGLAGASFSVTGARPDRNAALLSAGADIKLSPSVSLGMRIDSELAAKTRRIGGTAQLRVSF
ncbi:autotransporter-associated beta strand repeat-containing protein [Bosea sp. 685]|uniref:autotransporter-associated beta strand repeat-containing protein n=1 Tax=Bosea sp. 685 TaxID=3080057 RepID=UPI002892B5CC|nr:autotransporter-associated beta strand repeat-containing protein [Bosea sp. 685]WNJ88945.1 autotransporter-associated beta strand repeat-containing protein [Bosea sp. 685]